MILYSSLVAASATNANGSERHGIYHPDFDAITVTVIAVESLLGLLIILVNCLCLWLVFGDRQLLQSSNNIYIISMCVGDIGVGLLVPVIVVVVHMGLPTELHACVLVNCVVNIMMTVSVLALTCVVGNRYSYLIRPVPLHLEEETCWSWAFSGLAWLVALGVGLTPYLGWYREPPGGFRYCSYEGVIPVEYNVYMRFFGLTLPVLLVMLLLNGHIFVMFFCNNRQIRRINAISSTNLISQSQSVTRGKLRQYLLFDRREKRLLRALAFMFFALSLTLIPLDIINAMRLWYPDIFVPRALKQFFIVLSHTNPLIDPVLYVFNQNSMRRALRRWLRFSFPRPFLSGNVKFLRFLSSEDIMSRSEWNLATTATRTSLSLRTAPSCLSSALIENCSVPAVERASKSESFGHPRTRPASSRLQKTSAMRSRQQYMFVMKPVPAVIAELPETVTPTVEPRVPAHASAQSESTDPSHTNLESLPSSLRQSSATQ